MKSRKLLARVSRQVRNGLAKLFGHFEMSLHWVSARLHVGAFTKYSRTLIVLEYSKRDNFMRENAANWPKELKKEKKTIRFIRFELPIHTI